MSKQKFRKPALTINQQLELFKKRNLPTENIAPIKQCLETISYYRLSGYCKIFQNTDHSFKANTNFQQIMELYTFDQELRLLVLKAIEKIEIAFRTAISNYMSVMYTPLWYKNATLFKSSIFHKKFMAQVDSICKDNKEVFLKHYFAHYLEEYPPSWMITECISFGTSTLIFRDLKSMHAKKEIAKVLGYHPTLIASWMEPICYTRNLCAHHSRLWNRWFVLTPQIPLKNKEFVKISARINNTFYAQALVIILLLKHVTIDSLWHQELFALLQKYPAVPKQEMGFDNNWEQDPLWAIADSHQTR